MTNFLILQEFSIQTDAEVPAKRPDILILDNALKERTNEETTASADIDVPSNEKKKIYINTWEDERNIEYL